MSSDAGDQFAALAGRQPTERRQCYLRSTGQAGENSGRKVTIERTRMLGTRSTSRSSDFRRGVAPMHILEDHRHRLAGRKRFDLGQLGEQGFLLPLLRCEIRS